MCILTESLSSSLAFILDLIFFYDWHNSTWVQCNSCTRPINCRRFWLPICSASNFTPSAVFNRYICMVLPIPVLFCYWKGLLKSWNYHTLCSECSMPVSLEDDFFLLCCWSQNLLSNLLSSVPVLCCVGTVRGFIVCLGFLAQGRSWSIWVNITQRDLQAA